MKRAVVLAEVGELTLQQLSINRRYQVRACVRQALLMLTDGKLMPMAIGEKLGVIGQSMSNLAHIWRKQDVIGLLARVEHEGARPRAMRAEMVAAVVRMASAEPLTRAEISQRLEAQFGTLSFEDLDTLSRALSARVSRSSENASRSKSAIGKNSP